MRISYLKHLSCPASRPKRMGRCGGKLAVLPGEIPSRPADDDDELLEGNVVCEGCGAWRRGLSCGLIIDARTSP